MVITTNMLKEKYRNYSNHLDKIKRDCDRGLIFRLTKGKYETNKNVSPFLLASHIIAPSYISFEYALSYYGLIPERVFAITSASLNLRKNKIMSNYFGRYTYSDIPSKVYYRGVLVLQEGEYYIQIASKEKAICDSLYKWPVVHSVKQLKILLFEDKRIDIDEFKTCDFRYMADLAKDYSCTNLKLLIALLRKEYQHE